jgi:hypothetical protein
MLKYNGREETAGKVYTDHSLVYRFLSNKVVKQYDNREHFNKKHHKALPLIIPIFIHSLSHSSYINCESVQQETSPSIIHHHPLKEKTI